MIREKDRHVQEVGFILLPGFALMSYASATEPLRAANLLAGRELYRLHTFSSSGQPVTASSGAIVPARPLSQRTGALHSVFVCAGGGPPQWQEPPVHVALRQLAREGVRIGGISGGPYLLAAAGLLQGRRFTIHWEHAPALMEAFPALQPVQARYVIDGDRITCGGGIAPLDMMHAMIAERMGADFARRVSDWYLHTVVGEPAGPQRGSLAERYGVHHPALLGVLEKMETTIERPLNRSAMARFAGMTPRHLDRLFRDHMARRLLQQSPLSVAEIAFATGFSSAGHFSRSYRETYNQSPREARIAV